MILWLIGRAPRPPPRRPLRCRSTRSSSAFLTLLTTVCARAASSRPATAARRSRRRPLPSQPRARATLASTSRRVMSAIRTHASRRSCMDASVTVFRRSAVRWISCSPRRRDRRHSHRHRYRGVRRPHLTLTHRRARRHRHRRLTRADRRRNHLRHHRPTPCLHHCRRLPPSLVLTRSRRWPARQSPAVSSTPRQTQSRRRSRSDVQSRRPPRTAPRTVLTAPMTAQQASMVGPMTRVVHLRVQLSARHGPAHPPIIAA